MEVVLIWVFSRNLVMSQVPYWAMCSSRSLGKTKVNETKWVGDEDGIEDDESGAGPALVLGGF